MDSMWQTPVFREAISQRLIEAIKIYGNATCVESDNLESYVFDRSTSKEEYLETSARIIVYLRKMNVRKNGPLKYDPGEEPAAASSSSSASSASSVRDPEDDDGDTTKTKKSKTA